MTTTTAPPLAAGRAYDPQVFAAWLNGYETGEHVGTTLGTRDAWKQGYDAGHTDGIQAGRRQLDAELEAAADAHSARWRADLQASANRPAYDELCDRRAASDDERAREAKSAAVQRGLAEGAVVERARAARQRQILRRNGVVPMHTATGHVYPPNWPESERYCAHAVAVVAATGSPTRPAITSGSAAAAA
ncbi:hypothetical protein AB1046_15070 [Promicromonospora sp. Populi]|uniref:hypothetical protein n=1 Tax=Promicromonospora sp. Populi TaxID=3239420 RepID=UPI0034E225FB